MGSGTTKGHNIRQSSAIKAEDHKEEDHIPPPTTRVIANRSKCASCNRVNRPWTSDSLLPSSKFICTSSNILSINHRKSTHIRRMSVLSKSLEPKTAWILELNLDPWIVVNGLATNSRIHPSEALSSRTIVICRATRILMALFQKDRHKTRDRRRRTSYSLKANQ